MRMGNRCTAFGVYSEQRVFTIFGAVSTAKIPYTPGSGAGGAGSDKVNV